MRLTEMFDGDLEKKRISFSYFTIIFKKLFHVTGGNTFSAFF